MIQLISSDGIFSHERLRICVKSTLISIPSVLGSRSINIQED